MAITPRVRTAPPAATKPPVDEAAIDAVINRGGTPAGVDAGATVQPPPADDEVAKFTLRAPRRVLRQIEADITARTGAKAEGKLNAWILEAITDRLRRRGDG